MKKYFFLAMLTVFSSYPYRVLSSTYGAGATSCSSYINQPSPVYFAWAQGFMSATSLFTKIEFNELGKYPDINLQEKFLQNYCRENPLEGFEYAVRELIMKSNHDGPKNLLKPNRKANK